MESFKLLELVLTVNRLRFMENLHNMTKEEFENILNLQNNLKELPNTKLIEVMDKLTVTFDLTKENVISLTIYLDKLEELYNNTLKEYQSRKL